MLQEQDTHKLQHVPVKDVVVGEALSVEQVPEELPQVRVVWLVVEPQGATQVQVSRELGCETQKRENRGFQAKSHDTIFFHQHFPV